MTRFIVPFGFLFVLIVIVALPAVIAGQVFGLSRPWPGFIGLGSLILTMTLGFFWLTWIQRNDRKVLRTSNHPIFGEIRHLRNHWEATLDLLPYGSSVLVSGDDKDLSIIEIETFIAIKQRLPSLLTLIPDQLISIFPSSPTSLATDDLCLDSVLLSSTALGNFDLGFSLPKYERIFPWGISITFAGFNIDEVSDNH